MKENNRDYMAWNAPGSSGPGNSGQGPQNNGSQNNGSQNNNNDPWGRNNNNNNDPWGRRKKNNQFDVNDLLNRLKKMFGGAGGSAGKAAKKGASYGLYLLVAVALGVYIFSGFYTVREAERGVVLRFGKVYDVVEPGLRWKFTGIDDVNVVDIEQVRAIQSSGMMLTEDENVVIVEMDVQYRISDPVKYLYSVTDPDNSLTEATDSALRYVVGHTMMDDILTSGREMVRQNTRDLLVSIIEPYDMGLSVVDVNFLPAHAPDEVKEAFDDAIAAQEDEQRFKREAEAYANEVLPRAAGQVQRITQEAEAYRSRVVLDAQGQVARFEQILPEYLAAPEITRKRIYLDTMQQVMGSSSKIILDTPEGSSPVLYLPLPENRAAPAPVQNVDSAVQSADSVPVKVTETPVNEPLPLPRNESAQTSSSSGNQGYGSSSYNTSRYGRSVR